MARQARGTTAPQDGQAIIQDERLAVLGRAQKTCREMGHSWPDDTVPGGLFTERLKEITRRVVTVERTLRCQRRCGVVATDLIAVHLVDGRAVRVGTRTYDYTLPYLIPRLDADGNVLPEITREHVRYAALMERHPELADV